MFCVINSILPVFSSDANKWSIHAAAGADEIDSVLPLGLLVWGCLALPFECMQIFVNCDVTVIFGAVL